MGIQRRAFTPEFKDQAVKLVINTGRPVAMVARELGIVEQTLGNLVKAYRARQDSPRLLQMRQASLAVFVTS